MLRKQSYFPGVLESRRKAENRFSVSEGMRGLDLDHAGRLSGAIFTARVGGLRMGRSVLTSITGNRRGRMAVSANIPWECTSGGQLPIAREELHAPVPSGVDQLRSDGAD